MYVCFFEFPQEIARLNESLNQRLEVIHQALTIRMYIYVYMNVGKYRKNYVCMSIMLYIRTCLERPLCVQ